MTSEAITFYNDWHKTKGINSWRKLNDYQTVVDSLCPSPYKNILDIGCGTGHLLKLFSQYKMETYGIDISEIGVEIARRNSPNSNIIIADGENIPYADKYFDIVTCLGALEHFDNIEKGYSEIVRVCNTYGLIYISVPNKYFPVKFSIQKEVKLSLEEWIKIFEKDNIKILEIKKDNKYRWLWTPMKYAYQYAFIMRKY